MMTIREAIDKGIRCIYLNNGTQIVHLDHGKNSDAVCPPKEINGHMVYRYIFCRITRNGGCEFKKELETMDKYKDVCHFDYILKERDMNYYISLCGGIDKYRTGLEDIDVDSDTELLSFISGFSLSN